MANRPGGPPHQSLVDPDHRRSVVPAHRGDGDGAVDCDRRPGDAYRHRGNGDAGAAGRVRPRDRGWSKRATGAGPDDAEIRGDDQEDRSRIRSRAIWAIVVTGMALFMSGLDNLVVSTALPVIRVHLHAGLSGLEWTVNAYTLTFAVLLLSAAAVGERFGRRRIFVLGIALFTLASAAAALAPNITVLIAARAVQGAGGAMIMPLSLTLLSAAVAPERRNAALGIWGAIGGAAVAIGPLVGGAVTTGWSWQYIFWLNVPVGVVLIPLAWWKLSESRGRPSRLDLVGVGLVSIGLFGVVLGLVRGNAHGWSSSSVLGSFVIGAVALAAFAAWELRSDHPMLDIRLFRNRGFAAVNVTALLFSFGMFGSIFFLTQFLQTVQGLSPLAAGIRVLPWTAMVMLLAPVVGQLAERWGGKPLVVTGLVFQVGGLDVAGGDHEPVHPLLRAGGALCGLRHGDDPLLRPSGVTGARGRAQVVGGRRLGRQQRFSRVGWGPRDRCARRGLQRPRRLPLRSGLRQRHDPSGLRRRGRRGHRCCRRPRHPRAPTGAGTAGRRSGHLCRPFAGACAGACACAGAGACAFRGRPGFVCDRERVRTSA